MLMRAHDRLTVWGVQLAMVALAMMVSAYVLEVVLRYGFNTPTRWSSDLVSYLLLFITFMALPQVTASGGHVAVTALLERISPGRQRHAARVMAAYPVPKAWVSVWIIYGLGSSALYFLRAAIWPPVAPVSSGANA